MTLRLGAIADDLTGATDLALMLVRGGLSVVQVVGVPDGPEDFGDAEAVVVALKSRTIPAAEAIAMSTQAAEALLSGGAEQLFFKYCSTFDSTDAGNIGPVADALMTLLGQTKTIACPAFPMNGRTVFQGHLFVGSQLLSESSMKDHPLTPMRDSNLVNVLQRQTTRRVSAISHGVVSKGRERLARDFETLDGIAIVDAIDDGDLLELAAAASGLRLVTGGSGIGTGLARNFAGAAVGERYVQVQPDPGRRVMLAGSCSAATRRQVAQAIASGTPASRLDPVAIARGEQTVADAIQFVLDAPADTAPLLYSTAEPDDVAAAQRLLGRDKAGSVVETFLGQVAHGLFERDVSQFIVAGGETSGAVIEALGATALHIGREIDPGVPWTGATIAGRRVALALKSGNFGRDDFFARAWSVLQ